MTETQAKTILESPPNRPAPANDFVTLSVTMTRDEWRAIGQTATNRSRINAFGDQFRISAWDKLRKSIEDKC